MSIVEAVPEEAALFEKTRVFSPSGKTGKRISDPYGTSKTKESGADGDRTRDLMHAMHTLSQLSYGPFCLQNILKNDLF